MLSTSDLKSWLHRDLGQRDKLLLILASLDSPCQVKDIKETAENAGFRFPRTWNPSSSLGRSKGLAIRTPKGWEITDVGKQHLRNRGVTKISAAAIQVATDLREVLLDIREIETHSYVEETVHCYEAGLYRSAIVMSWIGAVAVLQKYVYENYLVDFNKEAKRVNSKWKDANTTDDFANMKEAEFLDRIATLSIIGKNVKTELKNCLNLRNSCGHPNSLQVRANTVAHHLEVLLLNVFKVFH